MDSKQKVIVKIQEVHGAIPQGMGEMLNLIVHPDIIGLVKTYIWINEEQRGQCEEYIVMFDKVFACEKIMDHHGDHQAKTDDGWRGEEVLMTWAKRKAPTDEVKP